jgi:GNAT superfamily N-acetyltransferase
MSLVFTLEPVERCWNEVMVLAEQHWAGTKSYRRHEPFQPSFERYDACNKQGYFQLFTAREQGVLVGYFGVYLTPSMHSQRLMATEDTFYLSPDYRGGRNALRFLKHIEQQLRDWQVHEIMFSCEIDNETGIKGLLEYLDYSPVIQQYSKYLSPSADSATTSTNEVQHVGHP